MTFKSKTFGLSGGIKKKKKKKEKIASISLKCFTHFNCPLSFWTCYGLPGATNNQSHQGHQFGFYQIAIIEIVAKLFFLVTEIVAKLRAI